jgi:hypothetical protein
VQRRLVDEVDVAANDRAEDLLDPHQPVGDALHEGRIGGVKTERRG